MPKSNKPIYSMTAFARLHEESALGTVTIEIRSINHRFLDIDFKLPPTLNLLENSLREKMRQILKRGHIDCFVKFKPTEKAGLKLNINQTFLEGFCATINNIQTKIAAETKNKVATQLDLAKVLSWPNALEENEDSIEKIQTAVINFFVKALEQLLVAREREGAALKNAITPMLEKIQSEVTKAKSKQPEILNKHKQKIITRLAEIKGELDTNRLEQEMVYFAQKIDVSEEITRLEAHLNEFKRIMQEGGSVGKRLDFLVQELNREANTLASKSVALDTTYAAVEIKVLLEQIREQIQNIE